MSTFYVLPPRPFLGECFSGYLQALFPGLRWERSVWPGLADTLGQTAADQADTYVVYQEEIPDGADLTSCLADCFGAEPGDEVVEVRAGHAPGALITRRWRL
jgi:hypothetical protein